MKITENQVFLLKIDRVSSSTPRHRDERCGVTAHARFGDDRLRTARGVATTLLPRGRRGLPPLSLRSLYAGRAALMYGQPARMVNFSWTRPRTLQAGRTVLNNIDTALTLQYKSNGCFLIQARKAIFQSFNRRQFQKYFGFKMT